MSPWVRGLAGAGVVIGMIALPSQLYTGQVRVVTAVLIVRPSGLAGRAFYEARVEAT